jgi:RNA polymerase sigma-70 factor
VSRSRVRPDPGQLEAALDRGAARWPGLHADRERFFGRLGRALEAGEGEPSVPIESLHVEDVYLVVALEDGDEEAWRRFELEFRPHIVQALARVLRDPRDQDETADELMGGLLLPRSSTGGTPLSTYSGRGGLRAWLQVTAVRRVFRRARTRQREAWVRLPREPAAPRDRQPPEELGRGEVLEALRAALPVALAGLPAADRTLLRLRFQRDYPLKDLGRLFGQDKSTLSKRLKSLGEKLRSAIVAELRERRGLSVRDIEAAWEALGRERPEGLDAWLGPETPG